jgi:hypothetical protein
VNLRAVVVGLVERERERDSLERGNARFSEGFCMVHEEFFELRMFYILLDTAWTSWQSLRAPRPAEVSFLGI